MIDRALQWKGTYRLAVFIAFLAIWQAYASAVHSLFIPTVGQAVTGLTRLVVDPELWSALATSNQAMVIGFVLSLLVGIPIGLALGRFPQFEPIANVYINVLLVSPFAAIIPLLVMSTGIGLTSRVILIVLFAAVYVVVNVRAGVRQVDPSLIEMAKSFGASELETWRKVLLPASAPAIMTGVRIALARSIEGMVIIELLMVAVGIGNLILLYQAQLEPGLLYATVAVVVAEALLLITLAGVVERRVTRWSSRTAIGRA